MALKKTKVDSGLEKQFLTAFITSDQFISRVNSVIDIGLIRSSHFRQLVQWCIEYFVTYQKAPGRDIEGIYYSWAESEFADEGDSQAIFRLLSSLSKRYEGEDSQNVDYLVQEFKKYVLAQKLEALKDSIGLALQRKDTEEAVREVEKFRAHSVNDVSGVNPFTDLNVWDAAYSDSAEPLIQFPGVANDFLGKAMVREGFIGIQAPEKRGKTLWCIEFAVRALSQRRRVAFFSVGDLSQNQTLRRIAVRLENAPMWSNQCDGGSASPVRIPVAVRDPNDADISTSGFLEGKLVYKQKTFARPISKNRTLTSIKRFQRSSGMLPDSNYFMVSHHPTKSTNVLKIESILNGWEYELGFVPDVIIIDYADILAPESSKGESRDQTNESWAAMRRLSQKRKALVITPTQANASSYTTNLQTMRNFSEDKRKLSHVTGMLALNQTEAEQRAGIMRLNWVVLRESDYSATKELYAGVCPALGRMLCFSALSSAFRSVDDDNAVEGG